MPTSWILGKLTRQPVRNPRGDCGTCPIELVIITRQSMELMLGLKRRVRKDVLRGGNRHVLVVLGVKEQNRLIRTNWNRIA